MFSHGDVVMFELLPGTNATGRVYATLAHDVVVIQFNGEFYERPASEVKKQV